VLDRHGLVERRGRLRHRAQGTALSLGQRPNELWCTDYKGEFLLGNRQYCYPLTVTSHRRNVQAPMAKSAPTLITSVRPALEFILFTSGGLAMRYTLLLRTKLRPAGAWFIVKGWRTTAMPSE
jgi:hypothetical protein